MRQNVAGRYILSLQQSRCVSITAIVHARDSTATNCQHKHPIAALELSLLVAQPFTAQASFVLAGTSGQFRSR